MLHRSHGNVNWDFSSVLFIGVGLCLVANVSACNFFSQGRSVYDREGVLIGLEVDPSLRPTGETGLNNHPIDLTLKDLEALLQPIQVSGYSGTIAGLITKPQAVPLFTGQELATVSAHLATAFREAKPTERVTFSLPKPDVVYSEDRTIGALFFRGPYLHVVVTDHSSIIRTDTGGGDYKDLRDTKGMKLWVASPFQEAMVPVSESPRWAHFERVHLSLPVKEILARKEYVPATRTNQAGTRAPGPLSTTTPSDRPQGSLSPEELHRQMRELSGTNQELKGRLDEQNKRMQQLQEQIEQIRREIPNSDVDVKGQPDKAAPAP